MRLFGSSRYPKTFQYHKYFRSSKSLRRYFSYEINEVLTLSIPKYHHISNHLNDLRDFGESISDSYSEYLVKNLKEV